MLKLLAVSGSQTILNSIQQSIEIVEPGSEPVPCLFKPSEEGDEEKRLSEFDRLFNQINSEIQKHDPVHDRFIGIIDCRNARNAWDIHALTSIPGMIILAFPEILWLPVYRDGTIGSSTMDLKTAIELCLGGYSPLFDGDGLRGILLKRVRSGANANDLRRDAAFAIDEEPHFAFINTYTAFRFGYRGFPVMTARCAERLLTLNRERIPCAVELDPRKDETTELVKSIAVFEDICLSFPDRNAGYSKEYAFGDRRDEHFSLIRDADLRVVTTAAQPGEKNAEWHNRKMTIESYFRNADTDSRPYRNVLKAHGGTMKRNRRILKRRIFNYLGGKWTGYWLVNLAELVLYVGLTILLFIINPTLVFILLAFVFLRFSTSGWLVNHLNLKHIPYIVKRGQWPFLPKCYVNHDPVWTDKRQQTTREYRFWEVAHKPVAGIFGLRNKCGLPNGYDCQSVYSSNYILEFYRHAIKTGHFSDKQDQDNVNGHAAPGVALELATRLIRRAEKMKGKIIDAEGAIHAAVLADVALELLDSKTPAVSMEALLWKHYYEIVAECEFVGVRANLDMKDRYIDIHNAMGRICRADNNRIREVIFLSGMAEIIEKISKLLRDNGKLEEAAYFTTHSRRLHRKLLSPAMKTLMAYPEWVLRSKLNFLISFGGCFFLFFLYWKYTFDQTYLSTLASTCKVMLARYMETPPGGGTDQSKFIIMLARQAAVLHLGFITAHFLMFMNRK